jgi:hypothetical protein
MFLHKPPPKPQTSTAPPAFYRLRDVMRIAVVPPSIDVSRKAGFPHRSI